MRVEADTEIRYYDSSSMGTPSGLSIRTNLVIEENNTAFGQQGSKVPMTLIERAQDKLRQTVVASLQEGGKQPMTEKAT